jgi:hypothetical protein
MRQGDYSAFPADPGTSRALPGLFPAEADSSVGIIEAGTSSGNRGHVRPLVAKGASRLPRAFPIQQKFRVRKTPFPFAARLFVDL